ncbi:EFR1 family ferrodoxin [Chloroflexota bacterium]
MKSLIIYYSQTGNTRNIARAIHKGMSQMAEQCDIVPLKNARYEDLASYDLIGIGSPVWFAETPNVTLWIDGLPYQEGKHAFFFSTHGTMPKLYAPVMSRRLTMKNFTVIGWSDWYGGYRMEGSPVWYTDGHPDEIDFQDAEDFGKEMSEKSRKIAAGEVQLAPPLPEIPPLLFQPIDLLLRAFHKIPGFSLHGTFTYDKEKCTYPKCRLCVDNCPMGYIDLSGEPKKFGQEGDKCNTGCSFCEMICPTGAITRTGEAMNSTLQPESRRLEDIARVEGKNAFLVEAEEAEAQGKFRVLVDKEQVKMPSHVDPAEVKRPKYKLPKDHDYGS